jgi:hypothetical protein
VLVPVPEVTHHPGASPSCTRLYEVTLRGLREEATADRAVAASVALADAAYDAQHPDPADPARLDRALSRLANGSGAAPRSAGRPAAWQMTIADVAADLDVVDLPSLVATWARAVLDDWR